MRADAPEAESPIVEGSFCHGSLFEERLITEVMLTRRTYERAFTSLCCPSWDEISTTCLKETSPLQNIMIFAFQFAKVYLAETLRCASIFEFSTNSVEPDVFFP